MAELRAAPSETAETPTGAAAMSSGTSSGTGASVRCCSLLLLLCLGRFFRPGICLSALANSPCKDSVSFASSASCSGAGLAPHPFSPPDARSSIAARGGAKAQGAKIYYNTVYTESPGSVRRPRKTSNGRGTSPGPSRRTPPLSTLAATHLQELGPSARS